MKTLILSVLVTLASFSCRKTKLTDGQNMLPWATEKGRGIFGCYINETTYYARYQDEASYNPETGYLFIESANKQFEFRLFVYQDVLSEGEYQFDNTDEEWVNSDYNSFYGIKEGGVNSLRVTRLNLQEKFISGRFDIDLEDGEGNQKLIREGRFDLKLILIE